MPKAAKSGSEPVAKAAPASLRPDLGAAIAALPRRPGVYLFRDRQGRAIYVGKAKELRARVRSYFRSAGDGRFQIAALRRQVQSIEHIVTASEKEALLLEDTLIKDHKPRYNVRLRDDKSYVYIRLRRDDPVPYVERVRRPKADDNPLFGPFPSAAAARRTVHVLHQIFPLRTCSNIKFSNRSRPCLDHQIGRCPAPCVGAISPAAYEALVAGAARFLAGERGAVKRQLRTDMDRAAAELRYEDAAVLRDRLQALEHTQEAPLAVRGDRSCVDAWGAASAAGRSAVVVLRQVAGRLVHQDRFPGLHAAGDQLDLAQLLLQYYGAERPVPERILVPGDLGDAGEAAMQILAERRGKRVELSVPQRGDGRRLVAMAVANADTLLNDPAAVDYEAQAAEVARKLHLPRPPLVVECYDVSVHQGDLPVGVGVCFVHGSEDPDRRRRYRLTPGEGQGDVQWLREMLRRRLERGIREDDLPDLIVLDGGIAQLGAVAKLYRELEIEWSRLPLVALAKERTRYDDETDADVGPGERVFLPGRRNPVLLKPGTSVFRLMVALRDATHRAAVGYHRQRGRSRLLLGLEQVPGIGPARRRKLLEAYPDLSALLVQTPDEIARAAGIPRDAARAVRRAVEQLQEGRTSSTLISESPA